MTSGDPLVADSHAFIWYVQASRRLSDGARKAMDAATEAEAPLLISAATLVELVYLMEKGTFTQADVDALLEILDAPDSGFEVAPVDSAVARAVGSIPRTAVTDPFERVIAATALVTGLPLVTYDHRLRELAALETIW